MVKSAGADRMGPLMIEMDEHQTAVFTTRTCAPGAPPGRRTAYYVTVDPDTGDLKIRCDRSLLVKFSANNSFSVRPEPRRGN
jgi:hypothetical protein